MTVVGEAFVEIRPKDDDFRKDLDRDVSKAVAGAEHKVPLVGDMDQKRTHSNIMGAVGGIAAAVGGAFVVREAFDFVKAGVDALGEIERIGAQSAAAIKSTGGAAKVSAQDVRAYAEAIEAKTGIEAESVQEGENLLLTFTNVQNRVGKGNDVFNQATSILTDMSVALGTDVSGSAVQLGKALNDPIAGISALSRVGVTFDDAQKKTIETMVKAGDVAGAQKVILAELNKEFGGSAEAFGETGPGKMAKFRNAVGDVQESLARGLIPVITTLAEFFTTTALPAASRLAAVIGPVLGDAFRTVSEVVRIFISAMKDPDVTSNGWVGTIEKIAVFLTGTLFPALQTVAAFVEDHWKPILLGLAIALSPIGVLIAGIALLIVKNFDTIRDVLGPVVAFVVEQFGNLRDFTVAVWPQISEAIGHVMVVISTIVQTVLAVISKAWAIFGDDILRIVGAVFDQVRAVVELAVNTIAGIIRLVLAVINGDWGKAWEAIKDIFGGVVDFVISTLKNLGGILSGLLGAAFDAARRGIAIALPALLDFVKGIPGQILDNLSTMGDLLLSVGRSLIEGFVRGIRNAAGLIISAIKEAITDKLPGFVKDALGIRSPSRVFEALGAQVSAGFAAGISGNSSVVDRAMNDLVALPTASPISATSSAAAGGSSVAGRGGPAVWIEHFEAREEADVDVLLRRSEFAVQSGRL